MPPRRTGTGKSYMNRPVVPGAPAPEAPLIDATPQPFGTMPLPDARIVPARCRRCGKVRHYGLAAGVAWEQARGGTACLHCGTAGELEMWTGVVGA